MRQLLFVLAAAGIAVLPAAVSFPAEGPPLGNDLKATIALQGMPCDAIKETKRNSDSNYTVSCQDGNRYHVFVNQQGRVLVVRVGS
jgi:hypothetical protein